MQSYKYRSFLNSEEHGGIALVDARVMVNDWGNASGNLTLGDCSRQIHLDFDFSDEKSLEHTRQKLARLQSVLAGMSAAMEAAVPVLRAKWKEREREQPDNPITVSTASDLLRTVRRRRPRRRAPRG